MEGKVTITNVSGNSQFKDKVLKIPSPCAIILYGHGAELGDFK